MKKILIGAVLAGLLALPAQARNFAVPDKDPSVTLTVPDTWKVEEITYGYSAQSPGKDVFFSVEYANARDIEAMLDNNEQWMKQNKIKKVKPQKIEGPLNGIDATVFQFNTTDENGPTQVEFVLLPAGKQRMIMLTLWGSDEERAKHKNAIDAIMNSVKPIP
ncbi:hypothetical protein [Microvirga alba]|uniref:Histidine kinase n=1 Tax=Microvirga alba TaxID=2791025 RepID=A0A931FNL9_9HYPH|nr:hypothetical protein [Microvirga alba]MBF9234169.1 hypothetical protein [Microvirga alba]